MARSITSNKKEAALLPLVKADDVTARVVQAARQHFFLHGFRSVTMDDLAAELGMSKKTLYALFPSKTDLLKAALNHKMREVEDDLGAIGSDARSDHAEALQQLLACVQKHGQEIQPPFVRDMRREAPEMFAFVRAGRREIMQRHFTRILTAGRKSGVIRDDIPIELIIEMLLVAIDGILNPQRIEELKLTPQIAFSGILRVVLEGVVLPKARKRK